MEFLFEYGAFLLKTATLVVAIIIIISAVASAKGRSKSDDEGELQIKKLNDDLEDYKQSLEIALLSEVELKQLDKERKKTDKVKAKTEKAKARKEADAKEKESEQEDRKKRIYVLDFDGDINASATDFLRQEITAILTMAEAKKDEVVIRLESPGGVVHGYGFAASQLQRIRDKDIDLTVCVDHVAASGGYMMAALANKIVAAPFAIVGSIGVVAQLPNFNKVLKKHDIDYELFTAGEYKRTVTMFGENTDKAREKFQTDLEDTHELFKKHVQQFRPSLDVDTVANGDIWYGQQALEQGLIDQVGTSDDYIADACKEADVFSVRYELRKTLKDKLGIAIQMGVEKAFTRTLTAIQKQYFTK